MASLLDNLNDPISGLGGLLGNIFGGQSNNPQQQSQLYPQANIGGRLGAAFMGAANSGSLPQAIGNLVGGLATGQRTDPVGMKMNMMNTEYQALVGMPGPDGQPLGPQKAMFFMLHPQLLGELAKPQVVPPGGALMSGFNPFGGQSQSQPPMPAPQAGPLSPGLAAAAGRPPGLPPAPQAPPALTMPGGAPAQSPTPQPQQSGGGVTLGQNTNGTMSDDVATGLAQRYLLGDKNALPAVGIGSGGLAVMNRNKVMSIARQLQQQGGISDAEVTRRIGQFPAYEDAQKRLATVESNMGTAGIEFEQIWPQFMQAVQKYGNRQFPTWNALTQFVSQHAGDPNVAPLQQYITTLRNIYGRAISTRPQGPTVSDKEHFDESMSKTWNPAQLTEVGNAISNEINAAHNSIPKMKNRLDVEFGLGKDPGPDIISQAKAAMAKGVPREAVIKRLGENGYSARGF